MTSSPNKNKQYVSVSIRPEARHALNILTGYTGETLSEAIIRLAEQDLKTNPKVLDKQKSTDSTDSKPVK